MGKKTGNVYAPGATVHGNTLVKATTVSPNGVLTESVSDTNTIGDAAKVERSEVYFSSFRNTVQVADSHIDQSTLTGDTAVGLGSALFSCRLSGKGNPKEGPSTIGSSTLVGTTMDGFFSITKSTIETSHPIVAHGLEMEACTVQDRVQISGSPTLIESTFTGRARIFGTPRIEHTKMGGETLVAHDSYVGYSTLSDRAQVENGAEVSTSVLSGNTHVSGYALVAGTVAKNLVAEGDLTVEPPYGQTLNLPDDVTLGDGAYITSEEDVSVVRAGEGVATVYRTRWFGVDGVAVSGQGVVDSSPQLKDAVARMTARVQERQR